jgi:hypothetical protein
MDRGGRGGGEYPRPSMAGSLWGITARVLEGKISAKASAGTARKVFATHIAIKAHLSQSIGIGLSGQQGISPDICIAGALAAIALAAMATLAESGAPISPAITNIASSCRRIKRFTEQGSHSRAGLERASKSQTRQGGCNRPTGYRRSSKPAGRAWAVAEGRPGQAAAFRIGP